MTTRKKLTARTIRALCAKLDDAWYDSVDGVYVGKVPTWGMETEAVRDLIGRSCADGDIVTWDTRGKNQDAHLYLMRRWNPCHQSFQPEHDFAVRTHAELVADGYDLAEVAR
jgi:hypothetical protein